MIDSYAFRQFFGTLLSPYTLMFLLFTLIFLWLAIRSRSRVVMLILLFAWLIFFIGSTGWLSAGISNRLERQYPVVTTINPNIHWVVVLGGGVLTGIEAPANYLLTRSSISRLVEGVRLYRQLPHAKLLLSGGDKTHNVAYSTAGNMGKLAVVFDIPQRSIVLEPYSMNTAEEAATIKKRVGDEPFYLVTSAVHLPRAMALCHKQGLHPVAAPANYPYSYDQPDSWKDKFIILSPGHWVFIQSAWHEMLGRVWGKLMRQL